MADITSLGIVIDAGDIKRAVEALNKLQQASKEAEKNTKALGDTAEKSTKKVKEGADQAALALQREARAQRAAEQAALAKEKTATQTAKTAAVNASITEKALNQEAARIRAATRLEEGLARQRDESAKRLDLISTKQAQAAALQSKYTSQAQAIQERASAYTLNQQSLIEQRALKTQNSITASAQRAALMQEKFEFQKAQAAERAARRSTGAWSSFRETLSTLSDATVGGFGLAALVDKAGSIVRTADNMTLLDSRLKLATKSQEDFVKTQTAIRESSLKTGLSLEAQIDGFTQLERSTRAMKLSSEQLTFLTESFGKAAVVSGASTESYKSALTQLNQGFASGVIRGQEFNSVAEQAPAVMEALAAGLRGTNKEFDDLEKKGYLGVAALRKMAGEGKLVNGITIPALIEGLKQTNKQFDQMPMTVQRATEQISSAYKIWISDQNNASAATTSLAGSLGFVANNFQTIANAVLTAGGVIASVIVGKLVSSILTSEKAMSAASVVTGKYSADLRNATASALQQAVAEQAAAKAVVEKSKLQMLSATQITQAQTSLAAATDNVTAKQTAYNNVLKSTTISATAARTATSAFSTVIGALGGPIGIGITAIIALITYWGDLKKAIFGATEAHNDFMKQQAQITTATRGEDINKAIQDQIKHTENLKKQYAELNKEIQSGSAILNPRTGEVDAGRQQRANQQLANLSAQIRESTLKQAELDVVRRNRNALVTQEVLGGLSPSKIGGGPTPEGKKPKAPKLLEAGEKKTSNLVAENALLRDQLGILQNIDLQETELSRIAKEKNEWDAKADALLDIRNNKLNKGAKDYHQQYKELTKQAEEYQDRASLTRNIKEWEIIRKGIDDARKSYRDFVADLNTKALSVDSKYLSGTPEEQARKAAQMDAALGGLGKFRQLREQGTLGTAAGSEELRSQMMQQEDLGLSSVDRVNEAERQAIAETEQIRKMYQDRVGVEQWAQDQITLIREQAAGKRRQIADTERARELEATAQVLSMTGDLTSQLQNMLKTAGMENSKAAKAMFIANKAVAMANIIVQTQQGAMMAMGMGPFGIPMATWIEGMGAASLATVAATSVMEYNQAFAKGAAFDGPVGSGSGVVSTPTTFPMSGGRTGLMGEKGSEAIMPLSRDANGRLGVNVNGGSLGGGSSVQQNNITIQVTGGNSNEETAGVISRELVKTMERIADARIVNAKRPNGVLTR